MTVENTTVNRDYPLPYGGTDEIAGNDLNVDVFRLIAALEAIDGDVAGALAAIVAKASLDSPSFSGIPTAPTAATGTDSGQLATTAFVKAGIGLAIDGLIGGAPGALDTLAELAAALGDDEDYAATITAALADVNTALSARLVKAANLSDLSDIAVARANLGVGWEKITRLTTAGAAADVTGLSAFRKIRLAGYVLPSGGSSSLGLKFSAGGTFRTTGYTDQYILGSGSSALADDDLNAGGSIALSGPPSDLTNSGGVLIDVLIDRLNEAVYTRASSRSFYLNASDSGYVSGVFGGLLGMAEAHDGIRLQFAAHAIAAIDVLVEGMRS